jgi:hypothetical protein
MYPQPVGADCIRPVIDCDCQLSMTSTVVKGGCNPPLRNWYVFCQKSPYPHESRDGNIAEIELLAISQLLKVYQVVPALPFDLAVGY